MLFTIEGEVGGNALTLLNTSYAEAKEHGFDDTAIGAAIKDAALLEVVNFAEAYRAQLASQSAGKMAEYRVKEEIARDPSAASEAELALISREAKARGTNRTGLLGAIKAQADAYRQVALLIGALEAEAKAAIAAIPDDAADIQEQIEAAFTAARNQAEAEFAKAQELLRGS